MRKALVLLFVLMFVALGVGFAEETGPADWDQSLGRFGNKLRECTSGHDHEYTDINSDTQYEPQYGLEAGVDLIIWEEDEEEETLLPNAVMIESRWDFANENGRTALVAIFKL